jgi:uracil-DNA glycosylase family 4
MTPVIREQPEPPRDCPLCPRLVEFRAENRRALPSFHNAPVPSFGPESARLLIVGLAPGLKGANRTGRPFTGDYAGDLLFSTLSAFGMARGTYRADPDDGLELVDCMITNAVRCVPPINKPTGLESKACRRFLLARIQSLPNLRAIFVLGRIAHESVLTALGASRAEYPFVHAAVHHLPSAPVVIDSYHCSRYNTNTGKLTTEMFHYAFQRAMQQLG